MIEKYLPVMPYVRESRRIIPGYTLTANDLYYYNANDASGKWRATTSFPTSLAIGTYDTDLHNCKSDNTLETALENSTLNSGNRVFQIPFDTFIPETVDGFLPAEKNIGVSRMASGATREQPVTMATGQAVGVLAALAVKNGVQPRYVDALQAQKELIKTGALISLYDFTDVPKTNTYWPSIQLVSARNLMIGYGNGIFGLSDTLNRDQAAVVMAERAKLTGTPPATPTFAGVPTGHPFYKEIELIYRAGITAGCSAVPLNYCPTTPITRAQFIVMLVRALQLNIGDAPTGQIFTDVPATHWAYSFLQLAAQQGITADCSASPKKFCPDANISRGDAAVMLANSLGL